MFGEKIMEMPVLLGYKLSLFMIEQVSNPDVFLFYNSTYIWDIIHSLRPLLSEIYNMLQVIIKSLSFLRFSICCNTLIRFYPLYLAQEPSFLSYFDL